MQDGAQRAGYARRIFDDELDELLAGLPAVAIEGAKGVGKTSTALRRSDRVIRLDDPGERQAFEASPFVLDSDGTTLLDEWQRSPTAWDRVRRAVDAGAPAGSFILAGGAAPAGTVVHSGAGRIVRARLRPLSLQERGVATPTVSLRALLDGETAITGSTEVELRGYVHEITASGFPGIRSLPAALRDRQLDGYLDGVVEREFAEQGVVVRRPATLRAWLAAYAAATASTATYSRILDAATPGLADKPARSTTVVYRDVLSRAFIFDPLDPWIPSSSALSRLATTPRHFLADPALAVRLLELDPRDLLAGRDRAARSIGSGSMLGPLFEHLVAQSVAVYAQAAGARVGHLRVRDGRHEIDLIVQRGERVLAIEVKLGVSVTDADVRHLLWLRDQLGPDAVECAVVTTGTAAFRRPDGVAVVPAALLGT